METFSGRAPSAGEGDAPAPGDPPFGDLLRGLRESVALTQEELAAATGIAVPTISALERGVHRSPQAHTATLLADALHLAGADRGRFLGAARRRRSSRRTRPLVSSAPPTSNGPLLGRERESSALEAMLAQGRLITIIGAGGIGKTRLALGLAQRWIDESRVKVVAWVSLAETANAADVLPAITRALGLQAATDATHAAAIADALSGRDALLILDNLEHLPGAWAAIGALHDASPGLRILATSRTRLRLASEQALTLGPLPLPAPDREPDAANPAIALFCAARDAIGIHEHAPIPDIARVVSLLDGMPLAIELAAAQSETLPPAALADLLEHAGIDLLALGAADGPSRHQRLSAAIAWSADLLPEPARRLFTWLGIFRGGFTTDALAGIATNLGDHRALSSLPTLANAHLIQQDATAIGRFSLLEPIRLFALGALRERGEEPAVRRAHADWFITRAIQLAGETGGQMPLPALGAISADLPNFRQSIAAAGEAGDHAGALQAAAFLRRFWEYRGYIAEGRSTIDAALAAAVLAPADAVPVQIFADAWFTSGYLAVLQCDFAAGSAQAARLRSLAVTAPPGEANRIGALADLLASSLAGDLPEIASQAIDVLRRRLLLSDRAVDDFTVWALSLRLGVELFQQGDPAAALPLLRGAMVRARLSGAALDQPVSFVQLGLAEVELGEFAAAREHLHHAIDLAGGLGIEVVSLLGLLGLARAIVLANDLPAFPEALRHFDRAEAIRARAGYAYGAYWDEQIAICRGRIAAALAR